MYHATKYALEALSDALRFEVRGFGIQVVLIEPGLIRTGFGEAADRPSAMWRADEAYRAFPHRGGPADQRGVRAGIDGPAGGYARRCRLRPSRKRLRSRRPRSRYTVSPSAALFIAQRRFLDDWAWDAFLRRVYPSPGRDLTGGRQANPTFSWAELPDRLDTQTSILPATLRHPVIHPSADLPCGGASVRASGWRLGPTRTRRSEDGENEASRGIRCTPFDPSGRRGSRVCARRTG